MLFDTWTLSGCSAKLNSCEATVGVTTITGALCTSEANSTISPVTNKDVKLL